MEWQGCLEPERAIIPVLQEFKCHQRFPNSPLEQQKTALGPQDLSSSGPSRDSPIHPYKGHKVEMGAEVRERVEWSIFHNSAVNSRGSWTTSRLLAYQC